jgi:murein DD-endopeptidase MepM/ murein hydrolase activator NlpD
VTTSLFGAARRYTPKDPPVYHYGQDFGVPAGTPVRATNDGVVTISGDYAIRGGLVGIDHGAAVTSLYFHMSKRLVKVGQRVHRGDVIGLVGTTGFSTGPHLHWEMRVRGEATAPLEWVGKLWP